MSTFQQQVDQMTPAMALERIRSMSEEKVNREISLPLLAHERQALDSEHSRLTLERESNKEAGEDAVAPFKAKEKELKATVTKILGNLRSGKITENRICHFIYNDDTKQMECWTDDAPPRFVYERGLLPEERQLAIPHTTTVTKLTGTDNQSE